MNKKGFTLIELISTFSVVSIIVIILVNVIIILKETYEKLDIKSNLIIEQSTLSNLINSKLEYGSITSYESCSDTSFCYEFKLTNNETVKLQATDEYVLFDNYKYELKNGTYINASKINKIVLEDIEGDNAILNIVIDIKNDVFPKKEFGINYIYMYNSSENEL